MHGPGASESQREHRADGGQLHHWAESLIIVDPRALSEAPKNPTSLVPLKSVISPTLMCLDPLVGDNVGTQRTGHQIPGLVGEERRVLLFHRAALVRVRQCLANGKGYWRHLQVVRHRHKSPRLHGTNRVSCHHRVNMTRVLVKKRWVVHQRRDTGSQGPQRRCRRRWRRRSHRWWG